MTGIRRSEQGLWDYSQDVGRDYGIDYVILTGTLSRIMGLPYRNPKQDYGIIAHEIVA